MTDVVVKGYIDAEHRKSHLTKLLGEGRELWCEMLNREIFYSDVIENECYDKHKLNGCDKPGYCTHLYVLDEDD